MTDRKDGQARPGNHHTGVPSSPLTDVLHNQAGGAGARGEWGGAPIVISTPSMDEHRRWVDQRLEQHRKGRHR